MKFTITFALWSGLATAAKYSPGALCRTNTECNNNCLDGQWAVGNQNGDYVLVCAPNNEDTVRYFEGTCDKRVKRFGGITGLQYDATSTASACNDIGGESCKYGCVFSSSRTTADDADPAWRQACLKAGANDAPYTNTLPQLTKERAEEYAGCSR
jgi:hypothetical protein